MEKTIVHLHSHGLKLVKTETTYLLTSTTDWARTFDLSNKDWKSDLNVETRYLKDATKTKHKLTLRLCAFARPFFLRILQHKKQLSLTINLQNHG